ncbi:unnamed protein product [Cyprideis torosa]|uniref:Uncharacterized protein n=1 Tax=Cyprideis torosa TaxID=163714 RepID=A0A7R8ZNG2_9CRUS|nr:unnamed protein product [Cyprideis torosa]CAG0887753.1 unnamed protein product [Cyprideis torosa]
MTRYWKLKILLRARILKVFDDDGVFYILLSSSSHLCLREDHRHRHPLEARNRQTEICLCFGDDLFDVSITLFDSDKMKPTVRNDPLKGNVRGQRRTRAGLGTQNFQAIRPNAENLAILVSDECCKDDTEVCCDDKLRPPEKPQEKKERKKILKEVKVEKEIPPEVLQESEPLFPTQVSYLVSSPQEPILCCDRTCTDRICLLLYCSAGIAWLVTFIWLASIAELSMEHYPRDTWGRICGLHDSVASQPYLFYLDLGKCSGVPYAHRECPSWKKCVENCPKQTEKAPGGEDEEPDKRQGFPLKTEFQYPIDDEEEAVISTSDVKTMDTSEIEPHHLSESLPCSTEKRSTRTPPQLEKSQIVLVDAYDDDKSSPSENPVDLSEEVSFTVKNESVFSNRTARARKLAKSVAPVGVVNLSYHSLPRGWSKLRVVESDEESQALSHRSLQLNEEEQEEWSKQLWRIKAANVSSSDGIVYKFLVESPDTTGDLASNMVERFLRQIKKVSAICINSVPDCEGDSSSSFTVYCSDVHRTVLHTSSYRGHCLPTALLEGRPTDVVPEKGLAIDDMAGVHAGYVYVRRSAQFAYELSFGIYIALGGMLCTLLTACSCFSSIRLRLADALFAAKCCTMYCICILGVLVFATFFTIPAYQGGWYSYTEQWSDPMLNVTIASFDLFWLMLVLGISSVCCCMLIIFVMLRPINWFSTEIIIRAHSGIYMGFMYPFLALIPVVMITVVVACSWASLTFLHSMPYVIRSNCRDSLEPLTNERKVECETSTRVPGTSVLLVFHGFMYLWFLGFIVDFWAMSLAGMAVDGFWQEEQPYLYPDKFAMSVGRTFRFHMGTVAYGSFMMIFFRPFRWLVVLLIWMLDRNEKQWWVTCWDSLCSCCYDCMVRFLFFMGWHAYVITALEGTCFYHSCDRYFALAKTRFILSVTIDKSVNYMFCTVKAFCVCLTVLVFFYIVQSFTPEVAPLVLLHLIVGSYFVAEVIVALLHMVAFAFFTLVLICLFRNQLSPCECPPFFDTDSLRVTLDIADDQLNPIITPFVLPLHRRFHCIDPFPHTPEEPVTQAPAEQGALPFPLYPFSGEKEKGLEAANADEQETELKGEFQEVEVTTALMEEEHTLWSLLEPGTFSSLVAPKPPAFESKYCERLRQLKSQQYDCTQQDSAEEQRTKSAFFPIESVEESQWDAKNAQTPLCPFPSERQEMSSGADPTNYVRLISSPFQWKEEEGKRLRRLHGKTEMQRKKSGLKFSRV